MRHLVLVILCGRLSRTQGEIENSTLRTRHVEIDKCKYTKKKLEAEGV